MDLIRLGIIPPPSQTFLATEAVSSDFSEFSMNQDMDEEYGGLVEHPSRRKRPTYGRKVGSYGKEACRGNSQANENFENKGGGSAVNTFQPADVTYMGSYIFHPF